MITVRRALAEDFEKIYPLLLELDNPYLTKDDWMQLFVNHYGGNEDYFGHVLIDQDKLVGFFGSIFSNRLIDGKQYKFCNLTSLVIEKEYRKQGLGRLLILENSKSEEYTITALTTDPRLLKMFKDIGFKELEDSYRLILPIPAIRSFSGICSVMLEHEALRKNLNDQELKIYNDHLTFSCMHILIRTEKGNCYIIARRIMRKKLPFAEVHYLSNIPVFLEYIDQIRIRLPLSLKAWGLLIEERLLEGHKIKYSIKRKFSVVRLFKSSSLGRDKITDNLYTELLVLNI